MNQNISVLDCTLRDGAYITNSKFGTAAIKGIIKNLQNANVEIIECGWLKDSEHQEGSSFYHFPSDLEQYLIEKKHDAIYSVMIDWDRYNLTNLPLYDGKSIDAIRVVFPHGKYMEGIQVGAEIQKKNYKVYFQAANTLAYSDEELKNLALEMNKISPVALSIVDTFGAMYDDDLERIVRILDKYLNNSIQLGFHSHNNQQLSFSLSIKFMELLTKTNRKMVVDSSLCGMGRGAGNTTTELLTSYLNKKQNGNYDLNLILDTIDTYMQQFQGKYKWGYSTPYFISGLYCTHVNNIAYLMNNHRANAKDIFNIVSSLSDSDRIKYDYDLLEKKYLEYEDKILDDEESLNELIKSISDRVILLLAPGKSIIQQKKEIMKFINDNNPIVIGVNAIIPEYKYDYLFLCNKIRYDYAKDIYKDVFQNTKRIITSNVKTEFDENEILVNFNMLIKRGWKHFDNAVITCLRLINRMHIKNVVIAGFDGFSHEYNKSYADESIPSLSSDIDWDELNTEITDMFIDFKKMTNKSMNIKFITDSIYNK